MLTAFELIRKYWKALAIAAVLAIAAYELVDLGRQIKEKEWSQRWSQRDLDDAQAKLTREEEARQLEQSWRAKVDQQRNERDAKVQEVRDGATRVAANTGRLHLAAIKAERSACQLAASAPGRESPGSVLTDVLNRVGSRTGELAAYADELRAALNECRNSWPQ